MFRWLGPFPTHDYDLWNRTSGQKVPFWAFGIGPSAEIVGKSQGEVYKNNALGKNDHVWTFFWVHGWPYRANNGETFVFTG